MWVVTPTSTRPSLCACPSPWMPSPAGCSPGGQAAPWPTYAGWSSRVRGFPRAPSGRGRAVNTRPLATPSCLFHVSDAAASAVLQTSSPSPLQQGKQEAARQSHGAGAICSKNTLHAPLLCAFFFLQGRSVAESSCVCSIGPRAWQRSMPLPRWKQLPGPWPRGSAAAAFFPMRRDQSPGFPWSTPSWCSRWTLLKLSPLPNKNAPTADPNPPFFFQGIKLHVCETTSALARHCQQS